MFLGNTGAYPTVAPGTADLVPIVQGGIVKTATVAALAGSAAVAAVAASFPGRPPSVMASPPTVTAGAANAATAISGSVLVSPFNPFAFNYLGGPVVRGNNYPLNEAYILGNYPQVTSQTAVAIEFDIDTVAGKIEVYTIDGVFRLLVGQQDGTWAAATSGTTISRTGTGNFFLDLVTFAAGGRYRIRLEMPGNSKFFGIRCGPTDNVRATPEKRVVMFAGDSFSECTITDTGTVGLHDGYVQQLSYLTGWDCWSAGSGGTGYVDTNGARPKLYDRLANDVIAFAPREVVFAMGLNDNLAAQATLATEVANCITLCKNAGIAVTVCSPFWPKGCETISSDLWQAYDIIKAAAAAAACPFIDFINQGPPAFLAAYASWSSTISAAVSSGATTLQVADVPAYFKVANNGADGWWLHIGAVGSANQTTIPITNITGTGPYTLTTTYTALGAYASNTVVRLGGPSYVSGTGQQGTPTGSGTADRFTGNDNTHPTVLGHLNIAYVWARLRALYGLLA